jgi:hypothetical protein
MWRKSRFLDLVSDGKIINGLMFDIKKLKEKRRNIIQIWGAGGWGTIAALMRLKSN